MRRAVLVAVSIVFAFVLIEGTASTLGTFGRLFSNRGRLAETRFVQHDAELGWVNIPHINIPDMFGEGGALRTNGNGFRSNVEHGPRAPAGKTRVICSGDSFAFGYGVDNDHTWCEMLGQLDPRIESINMGEAGYGLDQAYLRYRRDGLRFNAAVHVFAFSDAEFERMGSSQFLEYRKPTLAIDGDRLRAENIPVPQRPFYAPSTRTLDIVRSLNAYKLIDRVAARWRTPAARPSVPAVRAVALRVFAELRDLARAQHSALVLVYLPEESDCHGESGTTTGGDWWPSISDAAGTLGVDVVDLTDACRGLPAHQVDELFLREGVLDYYEAAGHYTEKGNRFVALRLYERLRALISSPK